MKERFATALNCIDGRTQIPVIKWLKENFDVDYVDLITEPGIVKVLSEGDWFETENLKEKVKISMTAHDSKVVAVVAHYDCAANPVSTCQQIQQIEKSVYMIRSWQLPMIAVGLWVDKFWHVHVINI